MLAGIKTFRLKCNKTKLERLQEKSSADSIYSKVDLTEVTCFLCDTPAGSACFHECSTYDIDMRVRPEMDDGPSRHCPAGQAWTWEFDYSGG